LEIFCDRARRIPDRSLVELLGNVEVREGKRRLLAERVYYYEDRRVQEAIGNVKMSDDRSELTAHKVTYFERDSLVVAELDVVMNQREKRVRLTSGKAEYRRREEYAKATIKPVLVELDSLGAEHMRITGEVVEMFSGGSRAKVTNNVEIIRDETRATCGEAEYFRDEKRLELRFEPVALREDEETKGEKIELFFNEEQKLVKSVVSGNATATSTVDSVRTGQRLNALSGGTITTHFKNEQADQVVVEETATSVYYVIEDGKEKGANRVQGDRITLFVEDKELKRVVVESRPGVSNGRFDPMNSALSDSSRRPQNIKIGN
jgi:lipopolysaccharide export system protein LptA